MSKDWVSGRKNKDLEAILDECLGQLDRSASVEACAAQYPQVAAEIEPLLRVARRCQELRRAPEPSPIAMQAGRQKLLSEAARLKSAAEKSRARSVTTWLRPLTLIRKSAIAGALVILLLVVALGSGTLAASARSLPGDALYPVKRVTEDLQLALTFDRQAKAQLLAKFDERRRQEAKAIAGSQRIAEMSFRGQVESQDGSHWTVGGVLIHVSDETVIEGDIQPGTLVQVTIRSFTDGTLWATRISAEPQRVSPAVTATPMPAWTATTAPTQAPTQTSPVATSAPVRVSLPTATVYPSPTHRATATPSPTATAIPATAIPAREVKVRFRGRIEAMTENAWTIDGRVVQIRPDTRIRDREQTAAVGVMVTVLAIHKEDDTLVAIEISTERAPQTPEHLFEFQGLIESFGPTQWVVGGYTCTVTADTIVEGSAQRGLLAEVKAVRQSDGSLRATRIVVIPPTEEVQFEGIIRSFNEEEWVVDGTTVRVDTQTVIVGTPVVGYAVEVQGLLLADGAVLGRRVVVQLPSTATPSATAPAGEIPLSGVIPTETMAAMVPQSGTATPTAQEPCTGTVASPSPTLAEPTLPTAAVDGCSQPDTGSL